MSNHSRSVGHYIEYNQSTTIPCLAFCALVIGILALLPLLSDAAVQVLRPAFIALCILFHRAGHYRLTYEKLLILLLIYLLIPLGMDHDERAITSYISMVLFALFFWAAGSSVWTKKQIRLVFLTVVISCTFYALILIYSNEYLWQMGGNQRISFLSQNVNRNPACFSVAPGILCAVYLFIYGYKNPCIRLFLGGGALICAYTIIMLACRSAFVASFAGLMLLLWEACGTGKNGVSAGARRAILIVVLVAGLYLLYGQLSGSNSARLFDYSDTGREDIWDKAVELIRAKPLLGGGFNYWSDNGLEIGTHNTFFTFMLISGYPGGILLGLFFLAFIKECLTSRNLIALAFFAQTVMHSISEAGLDYYAYFPLCFAAMILRSGQALRSSPSYASHRKNGI